MTNVCKMINSISLEFRAIPFKTIKNNCKPKCLDKLKSYTITRLVQDIHQKKLSFVAGLRELSYNHFGKQLRIT